ncbi:MAG: hypothetical protein MUF51_04610 [Vicinamibacteria bacterium]|jgi:hypothetical protein|nr:hypothetical protein [Vicinamibacteria bacterium]
MRRLIPLLALIGWPIAASAQTRPLLTEEATTARAGTLVVESGFDFMHAEPNFLTNRPRDRVDVPSLRFVYSPGDTVELDLEWAGGVFAIHDPTYGSVSDFGDITLRTKLRCYEDPRRDLTLSVRSAVTLPQTAYGTGLGLNIIRTSNQLLLTRRLKNASLHVNAGLAIHDKVQQLHAQRDFFAYGVGFTRDLPPRLELVGEIGGRIGNGPPGADERSEARLGLRYLREEWRGDCALRRSLVTAGGTWGLTCGVNWDRGRKTPRKTRRHRPPDEVRDPSPAAPRTAG